jgi:hypothetical protein
MLRSVRQVIADSKFHRGARLRVDRATYCAALTLALCATLLAPISIAACLLILLLATATSTASLFMDPSGHLHRHPQPVPGPRGVQPSSRHVDRLAPVKIGRIIDRPHLFRRYERYDHRVAR